MINKIKEQDLQDNILLDVRKAYRLLFLYQQRVLSSIKVIQQKLKLNEPTGWAKASKPIRQQQKAVLSKNPGAWDWLAMYNYEFYFDTIPNTKTYFSILIVSDSGLFEKNEIVSENHQKFLDINNYATPEKSDTLVVFFASTNIVTLWFNKDPISKNFYKQSCKKGSDPYFFKNDAGDKFFSMSFPMSKFIDEKGISTTVDKFVTECREKGIDIKPEPKQDKSA